MRLHLVAVVILVAGLLAPTPAVADPVVELGSVTSIQLRQDLDRVLRLPLYEDVSARVTADLPGTWRLRASALLRLDTVIRAPGGDVDLYLGSIQLRRARRAVRFEIGRHLLRTPAGLRMADGVSVTARPARAVRVQGAAAWLRDWEFDDFGYGGEVLVQGGVTVEPIRGLFASGLLAMRVGPQTSLRMDAQFTADAVLPARWAPHPWIDGSFRVDSGALRRLRGGLELTPSARTRLEVFGSVVNVADPDGTMAQRILQQMTSAPTGSGGLRGSMRFAGGLSATAAYRVTGYRVGPSLVAVGHGVDVAGRWSMAGVGLRADYQLRTSYAGVFHAAGVQATLTPHRRVSLTARGQVAPYRKGTRPWAVAHWWLARVAVRPADPVELGLGGEYRSGALLKHDLRVTLTVAIHARFGGAR